MWGPILIPLKSVGFHSQQDFNIIIIAFIFHKTCLFFSSIFSYGYIYFKGYVRAMNLKESKKKQRKALFLLISVFFKVEWLNISGGISGICLDMSQHRTLLIEPEIKKTLEDQGTWTQTCQNQVSHLKILLVCAAVTGKTSLCSRNREKYQV